MKTFEAIYSRRSIRIFKPQAIPRGDIARIIDAARWAPSWKNSQ
ncbi:MAG: nitroreductase family protein [Dehalococcoidales bacterium]|nr:nitroreductase family protein [Dehalococcoidales bacterium]